MKNSTLLRLFLICFGIPLIRASSSKLKSKTSALILSDTTNSAPAVQLKEQSILVESAPEKNLVPEIDTLTFGKLKEFFSKGQYGGVIKLADCMDKDKFLKYLCQVVTTLDQFKGLYEYLKQREMVPSFLAHGEMVVVKKVIVESSLLKTDDVFGYCDSIYDAIALSFKEDSHERAAGLFEAAQERPDWKGEFGWFVRGFFDRYPPEKDSMPLKRFFTLHGEELSKKHPAIFKTICQELVVRFKYELDNLGSQRLLIDLVGQPSLLTPAAFAGGSLYEANGTDRANFIKYGYKEAIEEGLKKEYGCGRGYLWAAMVSTFPNQFSAWYPDTDEARTAALKDFKPTKQDREEEWAKEHAPNFQKKVLERLNQYLDFIPSSLVTIIHGYTTISATWLDIE